jgi:2-iminobutanoate/2-iminopropanoate deaminase
VIANGFVFISGQGPDDPEAGNMAGAFADQVRQTFKNVQTILEAAGSSLENVVKVNAYVTDLTRFAQFNEVYEEFFGQDPRADDRSRRSARIPGGSRLHPPCFQKRSK